MKVHDDTHTHTQGYIHQETFVCVRAMNFRGSSFLPLPHVVFPRFPYIPQEFAESVTYSLTLDGKLYKCSTLTIKSDTIS